MAIRLVASNDLIEEICKVMNIDPSTVHRIVIDAEWREPLLVYFEHVGTSEVVKINWGNFLEVAEETDG